MGNLVSRTFERSSNFVVPAGVNSVTVSAIMRNSDGVSIGTSNCWFLTQNGAAYSSGSGASGALGNGTVTSVSSPVLTSNFIRFTKLIGRGTGAIGITDQGHAYSFGFALDGWTGYGDNIPRSTPTLVVGGYQFADIVLGRQGVIGLSYNGRLYSWGRYAPNQTAFATSSPLIVASSIEVAKVFDSGDDTIFVQDRVGNTYSFGNNSQGQAGVGSTTYVSSPTLVLGGAQIKQVVGNASGGTYFLDTSSNLYAVGSNIYFSFGNGQAFNIKVSSPILIANNVASISTTIFSQHSFYIDNNGNGFATGDNNYGNLGVGDVTARSSWTAILGGIKWKKLITTNVSSFGISQSDDLYAWGLNFNGGLGLNDRVDRSSPVLVLPSVKFSNIYALGQDAVAISTTGVIYAWGQTANKLGLGNNGSTSSPAVIVGANFSVPAVEATQNLNGYVAPKQIAVTPGVTYPISVGAISYFGTTPVAQGFIDKIVVTYQD